jgi:glycosyltransferase involved in cell wall biosynthesis
MSDRDADVLHVIGRDTPGYRVEALRALRAGGELGGQRVVQFGGGQLDQHGLGAVAQVRAPFGVGRLGRPSLGRLLGGSVAPIVHIWSGVALEWVPRGSGFRLLIDIDLPRDAQGVGDRLRQLSSSGRARFVCTTEQARRRLGAVGVGGNTSVVIRDSVEFAAIEAADRDEARRQLEIAVGQTAVLVLPPLRRETGALLAAWGVLLLEHARPGVRLLVPDVGREAGRVARLVESCGLRRMLRLVEWRFSLPELLAAADLAIYLPGGDAPLWGVVHAMAAGRPIVATDVPVTRELLGHGRTAWLCGVDNPQDTCRAMLGALEDRAQSARQVRAARAQANAAFGRPRMIEQYSRVYQSLLADRLLDSSFDQVALVH